MMMESQPHGATLTLCMGSACHQHGVYAVLKLIQQEIETYHLQERLILKGAFCLGECAQGINMEFQGQRYHHISADNIQEIFEQEIVPAMLGEGEKA
jgi:NADH:ubiquinone oxidoreductase subunit E